MLTVDEAAELTIAAIVHVAPDVEEEIDQIDRAEDLWEALGLDSMDHLNVMTELAQRTGIEIAERDYGRLRSVDALAEHLSASAV